MISIFVSFVRILFTAGMGYPDLDPFRSLAWGIQTSFLSDFLPPKISVFLLLVPPFHLSLVVSFGSGRWWRVVLLFLGALRAKTFSRSSFLSPFLFLFFFNTRVANQLRVDNCGA